MYQVKSLYTLCMMVVLAACQSSKNEPVPAPVEQPSTYHFRNNATNMHELLHINNFSLSPSTTESTNGTNDENQIDKYLYYTAEELKNIVATDLSVRNWIINRSLSTKQEVVKLNDLINDFPTLQRRFSAFGRKFNS